MYVQNKGVGGEGLEKEGKKEGFSSCFLALLALWLSGLLKQ